MFRRYEIYLANLDPTIGAEINKTRPVVIVSDDLMNTHLQTVVTCPLTTQLHPGWRSRLHVTCEGRKAVRALAKSRLIKKLDRLGESEARSLPPQRERRPLHSDGRPRRRQGRLLDLQPRDRLLSPPPRPRHPPPARA
jgi:mRNA interferase MazF